MRYTIINKSEILLTRYKIKRVQMSGKGATQFGKSLYKKLIENRQSTERLFEQIYLNNVRNMDNQMTDEEAQQKMSTELINYTQEISREFQSPREREMAQGIVPYLMLEHISIASSHSNSHENIEEEKEDNETERKYKGFTERFKANLEKLKPIIFENITKHWRSAAGAAAIGGMAYAVTKFMLGMTANKALLMGGGLGVAVFIGLEVYEKFQNKSE